MKKVYKYLFLATFSLIYVSGISAKDNNDIAKYDVIPLPQEIILKEGKAFNLNQSTTISYSSGNEEQKNIAEFLSGYIKEIKGLDLKISTKSPKKGCIILKTDFRNENKEAYEIKIDKDKIVINGASEAGLFHGVQTLRKAMIGSQGKSILFPQVNITDYPRFSYRGMHFDIVRHFFSIDFLKKYIDILALHNINYFHLHLTDDQGWRVEIKKYPELTEIGAYRGKSSDKEFSEKEGKPYGGFYTQEEIKELVKYAQDRYITIIPEVDLPGHMTAALATYPDLGCTGGPYKVLSHGGIFEEVLCVGNEKTFDFLEGVFEEIITLFPSKYIHIGGDECPKVRWEKCPKCQAKIKELNLVPEKGHTSEQRLQGYCMTRVEKFLNDRGRQIIGWDEVLEGDVAPNATVMSWRGTDGGIAAARLNHDVIMAPHYAVYFDYYQSRDIANEPLSIGNYIPVETVYNLEPVPQELTETEKKHILGPQANLWTEYISTESHAEYMLLPRLDALSEVQWTMPEKKDYDSFLQRLQRMVKLYNLMNYNYAKHVITD